MSLFEAMKRTRWWFSFWFNDPEHGQRNGTFAFLIAFLVLAKFNKRICGRTQSDAFNPNGAMCGMAVEFSYIKIVNIQVFFRAREALCKLKCDSSIGSL